MQFGLMFFAASEDTLAGDKYRLLIDSARFADQNGFASVWVPERHFTAFGSLYPNPAVLHAALAMVTERVALRAGSVVGPLHNPLRIAEEWAVVDNLSKGRVGISFAPGWNPNDFALAPERFGTRYEHLSATIATVRNLWRGETVRVLNGVGKEQEVRAFPTPVQRELPVWVTAAASAESYVRAGALGANLLTHLLDQTEEELTGKIGLYRQARAKHAYDPAAGQVTVMLHTLVGDDAEQVREQARGPYCEYIRNNIGLLNGLARSRGQSIDIAAMDPKDVAEFVAFLYDRFAESRGLIGTPETCLPLVERLEAAGVNEIACLLDFGPDADLILGNLPHLARLRALRPAVEEARTEEAFAADVVRQRCPEVETGAAFHERLRTAGVEIGEGRQMIAEIRRRDGEVIARLELGAGAGKTAAPLDACNRVLGAAIRRNLQGLYLPAGAKRARVLGELTGSVWSHARLHGQPVNGSATGDVSVYSAADGRLLAETSGLRLQRLAAEENGPAVDGLVYRTEWISGERGEENAGGDWLIVGERGGLEAALVAGILNAGGSCRRVVRWSEGQTAARVMMLGGGGAELLRIVRGLAAPARLWIVTKNAVSAGDGKAADPEEAALWAIGRTIAVESAGIWGGLIDISAGTTAAAILAAANVAEDMQALRGSERRVPRLRPAEIAPGRPRLSGNGSYVVTGGAGGIGLRLAEWLRECGAGQVVLIARRRSITPEWARLYQADVADKGQLAKALEAVRAEMPPIRGVFHLAGGLDDGLLHAQTWERFQASGAGKRDGALHLHELTAGDALDYFVMFSSLAALAPAAGQGNYAAANAALDALAWRRRSEGRPGLSINWGPWSGIGHAATEYGRVAHAKLAYLGIGSITPDEGLALVGNLMESGATQAAAARVDWARLFQNDPAAAALPFLSERGPAARVATVRAEVAERLRELPAGQRRGFLLDQLTGMVRRALRLPDTHAVSPRQGLFDLGMDSIVALELKNQIAAGLGVPLRATLLFTHPNLELLVSYLLEQMKDMEAPLTMAAAADGERTLEELQEDELALLIAKEIATQV